MGEQRKNSKCLMVEIVKNSKQVDFKGERLCGNDRKGGRRGCRTED